MTATTAIPEEVPARVRPCMSPFYPRGRLTDGFGDQPREDVLLVVFGHGGDDGGQWRYIVDLVLLCKLGPQCVEVDILLGLFGILDGLIVLDQGAGDVCAASEEALVFWREIRLLLAYRRSYRCCGHGE